MAPDTETRAGSLLSGKTLIGRKVENPQGERLGRVDDLIISAEGGRIAYAVVSIGGVLSLVNKLFAVPWSALQVDQPRKKIILDLDRKTLLQAHGFDQGHWPDSSNWDRAFVAPAPGPSAPAAPELPARPPKEVMEHWGKSWESHGLDRS